MFISIAYTGTAYEIGINMVLHIVFMMFADFTVMDVRLFYRRKDAQIAELNLHPVFTDIEWIFIGPYPEDLCLVWPNFLFFFVFAGCERSVRIIPY